FVLWKKTDIGLKWKTNYSNGRPGWHTECAVLIKKYFNDQADIHGGGVDLKFPHHENENAQNLAINGKNIAKLWMHIGHLNVDNTKMSKSLNNFVFAKDLLAKYSANAIKWFFYQTGYSNPINFTEDLIVKMSEDLEYIIHSLNVFKSYCIINNITFSNNFDESYLKTLTDDLSLPNTVSCIDERIKEGNVLLRKNDFQQLSLIYTNLYILLNDVLGIEIINIHTKENIEILLEWNKLKNEKKFKEADQKRQILIEKKLI
ncbi:MAG: class I tRNA ligase family protein, partial [Mycoplasma sp.]|nr:class I tRNA ligase family protein [Mycoplasma sp.]